jgi:hypothetical protein
LERFYRSICYKLENQVQFYKKHVTPDGHISDGQKRVILQKAVNGIDELRQDKNTADHMATTNGSTLTHDEYTILLLSAVAYDDQFKPKKSKRQVFLHDLHNDHDFVEEDNICTIDCPVSHIQAYATNFTSKAPTKPHGSMVKMNSDKRFSLDETRLFR